MMFNWTEHIDSVRAYILEFVQLNLLAILRLFGLFVVVAWVLRLVGGSLAWMGLGSRGRVSDESSRRGRSEE